PGRTLDGRGDAARLRAHDRGDARGLRRSRARGPRTGRGPARGRARRLPAAIGRRLSAPPLGRPRLASGRQHNSGLHRGAHVAERDNRSVAGRYRDRTDAGQVLAGELIDYVGRDDVVVLGLARGGVPVAAEVASRLRAPLDAFLVRKLGAPGNPELAMGAIATGGVRVLNDTVVRGLQVSWDAIEATAAREADELARRESVYREGRAPPDLAGKVVILVDDGLA